MHEASGAYPRTSLSQSHRHPRSCFSFSILAVVPVLTTPNKQDAEDRSISTSIHQALLASLRLDLLPKTTIDVFINIIEADGLEACVAAGSIAASTALADAGIEMFGLVVACAAVSTFAGLG